MRECFGTESNSKLSFDELKNLVDNLSAKINGHGRVVIHPSGTEPKIRVWVCGDDEHLVQDFGKQLWNIIEQLNED